MELNTAAPNTQSISRAEVYPISQDYKALIEKGYELIAKYCGALWTNYNDSDPGATILQNLCYALTELGFKANLPIADILSDENGNITIQDHFHLPEEILTTNPITSIDFSKVLLDAILELKQVYFTYSDQRSLPCSGQAWLEVKPEYIAKLSGDTSFVPYLQRKAKNILAQHGNISQVFTTPRILSPVLLHLSGSASVDKNTPIEKAMAYVIHSCNNFLAPYPVYQNYFQLVKEGKSMFDLLDGPFLTGGYINDQLIVSKRSQVSVNELSSSCLIAEGVDEVNLSGLYTEETEAGSLIQFSFDESPYISLQSFSNLTFYQNAKAITSYDKSKVSYYLDKLTSLQQPGNLNDLLPRGTYQDIAHYYSIQNSFPSPYHLTGKGPSDDTHQAKVKQLKAYIVLFEQFMGDYLAQLKNVPNLFSFESGRTDSQLTSATYFTQPLYNIPGVERILQGVKGYSHLKNSIPPASDWRTYRLDPENPYASLLSSQVVNTKNDLSRKLRSLEHLLARYGKMYDHQPLHLTNPNYGPDPIAEIEYLKHTLKKFPLLSANRARTYFKVDSQVNLVSGLELNLENELALNSFLSGLTEAMQQPNVPDVIEIVYYDKSGKPKFIFPQGNAQKFPTGKKSNWIEVIWNQELLFAFGSESEPSLLKRDEVKQFLQPYIHDLHTLSTQYCGFILVDFARLVEFLKFRWTLKSKDNTVIYTSSLMSIDRLDIQMSLMNSSTAFETKEVRKDAEYEIGVKSNQHRYVVCENIASSAEANAILERLNLLRQEFLLDSIFIEATNKTGSHYLELGALSGSVAAFFPSWVSAFQQESYQQLLQSKLLELSPASAVCYMNFLPVEAHHSLVLNYDQWMKGLRDLYEGKKPTPESVEAAFELAKILVTHLATE